MKRRPIREAAPTQHRERSNKRSCGPKECHLLPSRVARSLHLLLGSPVTPSRHAASACRCQIFRSTANGTRVGATGAERRALVRYRPAADVRLPRNLVPAASQHRLDVSRNLSSTREREVGIDVQPKHRRETDGHRIANKGKPRVAHGRMTPPIDVGGNPQELAFTNAKGRLAQGHELGGMPDPDVMLEVRHQPEPQGRQR